MSLLRSFAERRAVPPGIIPDPSAIPSNGQLQMSSAGVQISERNALQLSAFWACVTLISDTVAALPVGAFRNIGDNITRVNPQPRFLDQPDKEMFWNDWMGRMMMSLLIRGNAYGVILDRDKYGFPTDVFPVHPDYVYVWREKVYGDIKYKILADTYDPFDILHIKGPTLAGSVVGLAPIECARQAIGLGLATQEFGARTFSEGTFPPGVLETEQELSPAAAKNALTGWERDHNNRSRRPAVLSGGLHWKPLSITPDDAQFLGTRGFNVPDVARFFRVPPHMIQDVDKTTSWGKGIEEQALGFVTYTLLPWLKRWEQPLTACLPKPQYVRFNVGGLLRGRLLERYQSYLFGRNGGWLTSNEIRELEELPRLEGDAGDSIMQPLNMGVVTPSGDVQSALEPVTVLAEEGETDTGESE